MIPWRRIIAAGFLSTAMIAAVFGFSVLAYAETVDDLKRSIQERNNEIQRLEEEAKKFRDEIAAQQGRAKTLSGELSRIDRLIIGLKNDITLTELFAYFTEVLLFRLNLVTDANRVAFLRLLINHPRAQYAGRPCNQN